LENHFEGLKSNGIDVIYLVSDDGPGLLAGHAEAIAHRLGSWVERFLVAVYAAIKKEYDCERKLNPAKLSSISP